MMNPSDEETMHPLEYSDDINEYYLGKVCNITAEAYCNIHTLLSEVTRNWELRCASGKAVLPEEQRSKAGIASMYLDFKFDISEPWETEPKKVKIKIRRDNLYVVAYHDGKEWHWLSDQVNQVGLNVLLFSGTYASMEEAAGKAKEDVFVGREHLHRALRNLHWMKRTPLKLKALAVMTNVLMISEPMRFESIHNEIVDKWECSCQLGILLDRVTEWSTSSTALRDAKRNLSDPDKMTEYEKDVKLLKNSCVEEEEDEESAPENSSKNKSKKKNKNKKLKNKWG